VNGQTVSALYVEGTSLKMTVSSISKSLGNVANGVITFTPASASDRDLAALSQRLGVDLRATLNGARLSEGNSQIVLSGDVVNVCRVEFLQNGVTRISGTFGIEDLEIRFTGCESYVDAAEVDVKFTPSSGAGDVTLETFAYDNAICNHRVSLTQTQGSVFPAIGTLRAVLRNAGGTLAEGMFSIQGTEGGATLAGIVVDPRDTCPEMFQNHPGF
jgi:hypothetical protein